MIEVDENIFVGNAMEANALLRNGEWSFVHCCKTFHKAMLGYTKSLPRTDPNYGFYRRNNRLALNLVDMDDYSPEYLELNRTIFQTALDFIDEQLNQNKKVLIHCDQGESRGPSIALLYLASKMKFDNVEYEQAKTQFLKIYPSYSPHNNIETNLKELWNIWCGGTWDVEDR